MDITSSCESNAVPEQQPSALLLRGGALLDVDEPAGLRFQQDILITGQRIQAIGASGTLPVPGNVRIIPAEGKLMVPGFVNAHTHSPENILKATIPAMPLELWGIALYSDFIDWTPRMTYCSALLGALEMLKSGTTSVLDHFWSVDGVSLSHMNAVMQAYRDAGIRATVAPFLEDRDLLIEVGRRQGITFPSHPFVDRFATGVSLEEQLALLEEFFAAWHLQERDRLRCLPGPCGIQWCSAALLHTCLHFAERYHTGLHLHAVETRLQARLLREELRQSGIAFLAKEGVLKPGTSLAHCIWLEPGDLEMLAGTGVTIVHNPVSNARLGSGRFHLPAAMQAGINIALGSDGSASNDTQNMFGVLKMAGLLHNTPDLDHRQWPAASQLFKMATSGGARTLGLAVDVGMLRPGYYADVALLDLQASAFLPLRDPYLHLVYCEDGSSVDTVIVDGRVVVERKKVVTVDEDALREEIRQLCAKAWPGFQAYLESTPQAAEVLASFEALLRLPAEGTGS